MKKTVMQSTVKVDGLYGVEIGDYAIVLEDGQVLKKPIPEEWNFEQDKSDGKVPVNEDLLAVAEVYNSHGVFIEESEGSSSGEEETPGPSFVTEGSGYFLGYSEGETEPQPTSDILVSATMRYGDKLGWEFFPNMYLLEDGKIHSRIPKERTEPAEGEFSVPMMSYITAEDTAKKLEAVAQTDKLGQEVYYD
jgi:hypothetical protein